MPRCCRCAEPVTHVGDFCSAACQSAPALSAPLVVFLIPMHLFQLLKTPALCREMVHPVLVTLVFLSTGLLYLGYQLSALIANGVRLYGPSWLWQGLSFSLALLLTGLLFMLLFLPLASLISIPFLERLSQRGEDLLLGKVRQQDLPGLPFKVWWRELLGLLGLKVLVLLLGLPLLLIPMVGAVLYLWLLSVLTAFDSLDLVLSRKGFRLAEKGLFLRQHGWRLLFFSLPLLLTGWIPVLQLLLLPAATLAAVHLFLRCHAATAVVSTVAVD
jgi:uncharacterized protein involved in cysteine biosynthesis